MLRRLSYCLLLMASSCIYADVPVIDASEDEAENNVQQRRMVVDAAPVHLSMDQRLARLEQQQMAAQNLDLLSKINNLQTQLQQQQGQIEVLQHDLAQSTDLQRKQYTDIDSRLMQEQSKYKVTVDTAESLEKNKKQSETGAETKLGENKKTISFDPATPANFTGKRSDDADYAAAYELFKMKKYEEAETALQGYLSQYVKGKHLDDAQFYLSETYLKQEKYTEAQQKLNELIEKKPQYKKIMEAHLKLAQAYYGDKNWTKAREIYTKITQLYPNTKTAHAALKKLQEMNNKKLFDSESDNNDT